jgi:hypothetical protein
MNKSQKIAVYLIIIIALLVILIPAEGFIEINASPVSPCVVTYPLVPAFVVIPVQTMLFVYNFYSNPFYCDSAKAQQGGQGS